jgi:hypothetical protein
MPNKDVPKLFKIDQEAPKSEQNPKTVLCVGAVVGLLVLAVAALVWVI